MITKESIEEYIEFRDERCKEVFAMRDKLIKERLMILESTLAACLNELSKSEPLPLDKTQRASHLLESGEIYNLMERISDAMNNKGLRVGIQVVYFFFGGAINALFDSASGLNYSGLPKKEKASFLEGLILVALWKEAK